MNRLFLILLLLISFLLLACEDTSAQTAKPGDPRPTATVPQPTTEQRAQLKELARTWETKIREADAARDKYMIALLGTLAELGLKPSETTVTFNDKGEPVFNRAEQAKTPPVKPDAKP